MWKECYRLGVDSIDKQHMELFAMTANLLKITENPADSDYKDECKKAILFLKKYALEHFADEENFQRSIQYSGLTEHIRLHREFAANVLKHEEKMLASDFDMADVINFTGMLAAWLAYHVADADQKIVKSEQPTKIIVDCFFEAFCTALNRMARINKSDIKKTDVRDGFEGDIAVSVDLSGDISCTVEYVFTEEFIFKLLKSFLFITTDSMDSVVGSVLLEISTIISKDAVLELNRRGVHCNADALAIQPNLSTSSSKDFLILDTLIGKFEIKVCS